MAELTMDRIGKLKLVPVIKLDRAEDAPRLAEALCAGGLPVAEITFRTDAAEESLKRMKQAFPNMLVGAGTILNRAQAMRAVDAGADFIVSPGIDDEIIRGAVDAGIPSLPGVCTPTEIMQAMAHGLDTVKFFPASQMGGVSMIKALSAPFPQIQFMPTGGVNADNLSAYLACSAVFACGGSWMVKDSYIREGNFTLIQRLTSDAVGLTERRESIC